MKRVDHLFDAICDIENIRVAHKNARKGKRYYSEVRMVDQNVDKYCKHIRSLLLSGMYKTSEYTVFTKQCGNKVREIYKLPYYPDRIIHHAILQIIAPLWDSLFIRDTYSAIRGRGIHDGVERLGHALRKDYKGTQYCLKFDIKKFYPSVDTEILKTIIRKKIKDVRLLVLLDGVLDSASGIPIGNYLSQYLGNVYLSYFDHFCKESLGCKYYYRYCDDVVVLSDSKDFLHSVFQEMAVYLEKNLNLEIKKNYQIFPVASRGIDFLGYVFYHNHIQLRKSIKLKMVKRVKYPPSVPSYLGWMCYANTYHLYNKRVKGVIR